MWQRTIPLTLLVLATLLNQISWKIAGDPRCLNAPATTVLQPDFSSNPVYQWESEAQGIKNVLDAIQRYRPSILERYRTLDRLTQEEIKSLENDIYQITQGHFAIWGLGSAIQREIATYFKGSYKEVLMLVFSRLDLNLLGFELDWSEEKGIESVRFVLSREVPSIVERYDRLEELTPAEFESLRDDVYEITAAHFQVWGLSGAMNIQVTPYFKGSYIEVLRQVFSRLDLNPLGFQLDWSTPDKGVESVRYVLSKEAPEIMNRYNRLEELTSAGIETLRNDIYGITVGHFHVWGLGSAITRKKSPYFEGSYIHVLISVLSDSRLGLTEEGFREFRKRNSVIRYQWNSGPEEGISNVRDGISRNRPDLIERYDRLEKLTPEEVEDLRNDIYRITKGHFEIWGLSSAGQRRTAPYFKGSHIEALKQLFRRLDLNPLGFELDWSKGKGIKSVRYVLSREVPGILERYDRLIIERYDRLEELASAEFESLRNDIYRITHGHFKLWGLSGAMNIQVTPYFKGSHMEVLRQIFSRLDLNPLGFQLDWSTSDKGVESVLYVLSREVPEIMDRYARLAELTVEEVEVLRNDIYGITYGHFLVFGLDGAVAASYFRRSHIEALLRVFSKPRLELTREGFLKRGNMIRRNVRKTLNRPNAEEPPEIFPEAIDTLAEAL